MLYRGVLSRLINKKIYFRKRQLYAFNNEFSTFWIEDRLDDIPNQSFKKLLIDSGLAQNSGPSCKIVQSNELDKVHLQLTTACICKCSHCYVGDASKQAMGLQVAKAVIDDCVAHGILTVDYSGGEPTLSPYFSEIIAYGKKQGLEQSLFTNGFFDEKKFSQICEYIDNIQISLDGDQKFHNAFRGNDSIYQQALMTMRRLYDVGKSFTISMSLMEANVNLIPHVYSIAQQFGAGFRISPAAPVGRFDGHDNDYYFKLLQQAKSLCDSHAIKLAEFMLQKPSCSAIKRTIYVDAIGDVYPCPLLSSKRFLLGNAQKDGGIKESIHSNRCEILIGEIERMKKSFEACIFFCPAFLYNMDCSSGYFGAQIC